MHLFSDLRVAHIWRREYTQLSYHSLFLSHDSRQLGEVLRFPIMRQLLRFVKALHHARTGDENRGRNSRGNRLKKRSFSRLRKGVCPWLEQKVGMRVLRNLSQK